MLRDWLRVEPSSVGSFVLIEVYAITANRLEKKQRRKAVGYHLAAAEEAFKVGLSLPCGPSLYQRFFDAYNLSTILHGEKIALAADYSAPIVLLFNYQPTKPLGFKRLIHPEEYMNTCQLDEITPFDKDKIPLVFVHGLASSPATWLKAINAILGDPVLRDRYQILVYSYPTGFPISYNSSLFRDWLKRYHDQYDSLE